MSKFLLVSPKWDNKNLFRDCLSKDMLDYVYKELVKDCGTSEYINSQYTDRQHELEWALEYTKSWYEEDNKAPRLSSSRPKPSRPRCKF